MVYPIFSAFAISSFLIIIKNRNISFNCPAKIEIFSVAFSAFMLIPARAVDRFFAVFSAFARSRV
jgi:hypothetical protein